MSLKRKRAERDGTFAGSTPERAIIDIGSNTVRMVVYGGTMRAPTVLLNEKVTARLGRDIAKSAELDVGEDFSHIGFLNALGKDGWEVFAVSTHPWAMAAPGVTVWTLRRQK